ncbi:unnamed protein product [Acanthocheilonema viteae]|uniref:Uncharacterized protein n=1 Tax=Acanthocheilonema viteae TaxID=6277 RepID=A0A498SNR9_ACAVI|nr:unnamed protein product [Acanthocheilonema viteae]
MIGPLTGVVVSKTRKSAFVWTPSLGEGICENDGNLVIGEWIEFTANLYFESHMHMNINFRIIEWTMADPILRCVPLFNNLMLVSTLFISHWPMNNLTVDWIGPITDRNHMLEKAVSSFGVGRKYELMLKRSKKSLEEPIAAWNVHQVLDGGSRRNGIVCFVNIQKSLALVYIQDANCGTGRMLRVDLKIFEAVPALGDWFSFKIDENNQFWTVLSAMKSKKLCASYIIDCQLEVETEVILTDKISTKGHRVMYSAVLGAIADDANRLSNIIVDASQKYTVWCTAVRERIAGDPYWRITKIPMKDGAFITKSKLNTKIELVDNVSYVGIVVSECRTAYFVWTFSLDEIICYYKDGLHIGDWIQFWIRRKYGTHQNGNFFCVSKWQKIDSLYPTREKNNTAVVTIELMIPKNYNSWQPPSLPFFGEVLDRKRYFESNIDDIRGHIIEMDIKHIRTVKNNPNWDIVFVLLKGPLHGQEESIHTRAVEMNVDPKKIASTSNVSVQNANTFFTGDPSDPVNKSNIAEYSCYSDFKRRDYKNHSPTTYNEKKKEHHEDYNGRNDSQKDIAELDPVICSMKLLLMSKEVRQAIKTNCIEEYTALRQYFDLVS